jgi:ubiquinone/menaquinone biosynthesis C-methylase UbiE
MHPRLRTLLAHRNLSVERFEMACIEAVQRLSRVEEMAPLSTRQKLAAAMIAAPGKTVCDVGGHVSPYSLVAQLLDTKVVIVDIIDKSESWVARRLPIFEGAGIEYINSDAFSFVPGRQFDGVSAFETIEHFAHSPKPALENMLRALRSGGRMCLSVPNIARIDMRFRLLSGRTVHENYANFYETPAPYPGHHREYTKKEILWVIGALGLQTEIYFADNCTYESLKKKSAMQRWLLSLEENYGIGNYILPETWRHHFWVAATKP